MELVYAVQILIALLIICVFLIVMITMMICGSYYCTKPMWTRLHDSDVEMDVLEPTSTQV